jgi:hypothetical protein
MRERLDEPLPVLVRGTVRGRPYDGEGLFRATGEGFELRTAAGPVLVSCDALDGVEVRGADVALVLAGGAEIHLEGGGRVVAVAREVVARSCTIPELTRALRTLGSRHALGGEQESLFGPLLAARRRAERGAERRTRIAAFDAAALREACEEALRGAATRRFPDDAPDRRALAAELQELAQPYLAALDRLERATAAVRDDPETVQLRRWREWTAAVADLFGEADRLWIAWAPVLASERGRRLPWWRRIARLRPGRRRELW